MTREQYRTKAQTLLTLYKMKHGKHTLRVERAIMYVMGPEPTELYIKDRPKRSERVVNEPIPANKQAQLEWQTRWLERCQHRWMMSSTGLKLKALYADQGQG